MYKRILAGVIMLLSVNSFADTSTVNETTDNGVLQNDYVKAGVNSTTGTFGSGGNTAPGLMFDSTGTGTFNDSYDYLTPGSPFDGFSVKIDGTNYYNNNAGNVANIASTGALVDGDNSLTWNGAWSHGGTDWSLQNMYTLGTTSPFIDIRTRITAGSSATDVWFARYIDPDARAAAGDSSATDNVLGYGIIPNTNVAFSEATVSRYALGLYSTDTNVDAGISNWTQEADGYTTSKYLLPELDADGNYQWTNPGCETLAWGCPYVTATDADGNPVYADYGTGDDTIGLSWYWSDVGAGDVLEASYAYIFGPSAFTAADDAITGGAGGGDTTTTDGWGTLEDVGSATDAAESGGSSEPPADPVYTYDYDSATYTDTLTAGSVNIIGEGLIARLDEDTGLYTTREASFGGTLDMTRDSDVAYTVDDGTSGVADVTELFTRTVSGTHSDVMSDYVMDYSSAVFNDAGTVTIPTDIVMSASDDYSSRYGSGSAVSNMTRTSIVPTDFTYDRTTVTDYADDFADDSGYADTTYSETTTSVVTDTYDVTVEEQFDRTVAVEVNDVEDADVARVVDWDNIVAYSDAGDNPVIGDMTLTVSDDFSTRTSSATASSDIERTSIVPTAITYDRTVTTTVSDDFADASGYSDTSSTSVETSSVTDVYNLSYAEMFTRTLTVDVLDVESDTARVIHWDDVLGYSDEGSVDVPVVSVMPAGDLLTRYGYNSNTGTIARTSLAPTTITYDRTVTSTLEDVFGASSAYDDVLNQVVEASVVTDTYNLLHDETYERTVEVFVNDILNSTFVFEDLIVKDSQGIDEDTVRFDVTDPISTREDFVETTEILWTVAGQEVYKVTTPTEYTYDRTVDVVVTNDFADSSAYDDSVVANTSTSVVSSIYDIITEERQGRVAGVQGTIISDVDYGKVAMDMNRNMDRYTTFGVLAIDRLNQKYGIYEGDTSVVKVGATKDIGKDLYLGAGIHMANQNVDGMTSTMDADTIQVGATLTGFTDRHWKFAASVQHTATDIERVNSPVMKIAKFNDGILRSDRISVPNMPNIATQPESTNTSASYLITTPGKYVRGVAGMTFGKEEYKDTESVVIDGLYHLRDESEKNSYRYGTLGAELNYGPALLSVLHHSDDVDEISFKLEKADDNKIIYFKVDRVTTQLGDTNSVRFGMKYIF